MRIAITGSWRDQDAEQWKLRNKAFFFEATSALGAAFAKLGHRLVVATDSKHTADWAAVDGAARAMPQRPVYDRPVVDLLRSGPKTFAEISASRPGFVTALDAPTSREVTKLYQVHLADVVLAIGGADKTLQATIAAAASGKRVLPVGCFGGAAEQAAQIFGAMAASWGPHIPGNDVIGALRTVWTDGSEELVLRALGVRHPKLLLVHGRDLVSRDALAKLLMRLELPSPVVMAAEPGYGRSLPENSRAWLNASTLPSRWSRRTTSAGSVTGRTTQCAPAHARTSGSSSAGSGESSASPAYCSLGRKVLKYRAISRDSWSSTSETLQTSERRRFASGSRV